jgi:hypothetical protein
MSGTSSFFRRHNLALALPLIACISVIASFLMYVWPTAVNVPYVDDFDAYLDFALRYRNAQSAEEKVRLLIEQHNEHRLGVPRLIVLAIENVRGIVDFRTIAHIAMTSMILAVLLVWSTTWRRNSPLESFFVLLPLVAAICQPHGHKALLWASANLPSGLTYFFAAACFWFLFGAKVRSNSLAAVMLGGAVFSQGNGVVVGPVVIFLLLLRTEWRGAVLWTVVTALVVGLYFVGYEPNPQHPSVLASIPNVTRNMLYSMVLVGLGPGFSQETPAFVAGVLFYLVFGYLAFVRYDRENPVLSSFLLFLLGSIWINALSRSEFGISYPLTQPHYRLLSDLTCAAAIACCMDHLLRTLPGGKRVLCAEILSAVASLAFVWLAYSWHLDELRGLSHAMRQSVTKWAETGTGLIYPWPDRSNDILLRSLKEGVFRINERDREKLRKRLKDTGNTRPPA